MSPRRRLLIALPCAALSFPAAPAAAQPADPVPPAPAEPAPAPAEAAPAQPEPILVVPAPTQVQEVIVVGTREKQTPGSVHVLKEATLERFQRDNPEAVLKSVPGVYGRGEDGVGLRPNLGLRGVNPDRSKKVTLMEDGVLFGPAPYSAPAAYYFPLITRMESLRVIKGPGAVSYGPQTIAGAVDFITRRIPPTEGGMLDLAGGQYGYGKFHGYYGANERQQGFLIEGLHLRSDGFKELDGGGDTGFERTEWMMKGRRVLTDGKGALPFQEVALKLSYSEEDSRETYLGLSDADFRANPLRRYKASQFDRMRNHRWSMVARHLLDFGGGKTIETTAYRHQFDRTWRKVNRFGNKQIATVLNNPNTVQNSIYLGVLRGEMDSVGGGDTIYIGPNQRRFVSEGVQSIANLRLRSGVLDHKVEVGARLHYDRIDRLHTEDGFLMRGGQLVSDGKPTLVNVNERVWTLAGALWAADAVTWKHLTLTPGARVEIIDSAARNRLTAQELEGATQKVFIPGIGAYLGLTSAFGLLGGVYHGFSPAASGQSNAQPERSWNYEAGARFSNRTVRLEAIGFYNDYSNLTSTCTFSSGCDEKNLDLQFNAGRARIYGAEAFGQADVRLVPGYTAPLQVSYTYTHTRLLESFVSEDPQLGAVEAGDELPYVPRHQLYATAGVESSRFGLYGAVTYVSVMREEAGQGDVAPGTGTDASWIFDLSARARVVGPLWAYLQLRNLFDAHDIASRRPFGARPVAPRWVQLGVKAGF
jgi:Fe(3+) dicitrate transport protein